MVQLNQYKCYNQPCATGNKHSRYVSHAVAVVTMHHKTYIVYVCNSPTLPVPLPPTLLQMLLEGSRHQDFFSYFQIRTGQWQAHITSESGRDIIGLYVDINDGWKVKVTTNTSLWDEFSISRSDLSPDIELCK